MYIKINPRYIRLKTFIESLPAIFEQQGEVIYNARNKIKVITAPDGTLLNVKRFHVPHGLNKIIYSWGIRQPKGRRAYDYAEVLTEREIGTPLPVALIEERNVMGMLGFSYLVTLQCDYGHTLYEMGKAKPGEYEEMAKALAHFAAELHDCKILHKDFTPGNVLWKRDDCGFHFMLVDINRMRFGTVSAKAGLKNLCRLWGPKDFMRLLVGEYARTRGYDEAKAVGYVMEKRRKFWTRYLKKHRKPFNVEL